MVAYTKPQQWKKERSERLRRERYQIKFIDLRLQRWQVCIHINKHIYKYIKCFLTIVLELSLKSLARLANLKRPM